MTPHQSNATPEVSVVMAVFNGAGQLEKTLNSVLGQQGCELEFIVVNDGSTDATAALLDERSLLDRRLRVIHQTNTGLTRALATGCAEARAPLIARQDAGDISLPYRFQVQRDAFDLHPSLSFLSCGTTFVEAGGAFLYKNQGTGRARQPTTIIDIKEEHGVTDGPTHHGAVMFRAQAYRDAGGYRAQFYFGQDWDLWYRLAQVGHFLMLPDALYQATIGIGDISTNNKALQERLAKLSRQALMLRLEGKPEASLLAQAELVRPDARKSPRHQTQASAAAYFLGECLRRNGNAPLARAYFMRSLRSKPWNIKPLLRLAQMMLGTHSSHHPS